jgi:hypothetical protein
LHQPFGEATGQTLSNMPITDLPAMQLPTSRVLGGELLHSLENNFIRPTPGHKTWSTIPPGAIRAALASQVVTRTASACQ